jgi:enoyl-CoA hydratase
MSTPSVRIERSIHHPRVSIIILSRPSVRNCVDGPTALALYNSFKKEDENENTDCIIFYGEGGNFCAGADLTALSESGENNLSRANPLHPVELNQIQVGSDIRSHVSDIGPMGPTRMILTKPVICAVSGYAVAGGLELSLWCDMRICETNSVFGVFCRRFGVPLIDGGTVRLSRLIGLSRATDLILTGRPVSSSEALNIGLVNRVVPVGKALEEAELLAKEICSFPQKCLRADRWSLINQHNKSTKQALHDEFQNSFSVINTESIAGATKFKSGEGRGGKFYVTETNSKNQTSSSSSITSSLTSSSPSSSLPPLRVPTPSLPYKCVIFDFGGVLLDSPVKLISEHEKMLGLPKHTLNLLIGTSNYFHAMERYVVNKNIERYLFSLF